MRKVAIATASHQKLVCREARQMLEDAGFYLECNNTGRRLSREEQKELIKDADAIIAGTENYDAEILEGCEKLRAIIRFGVGVDNFDLEAMRQKDIAVGVIANDNAVAEFAVTLMLGVLKQLPLQERAVREGRWERFPCRELAGKTVGLLGFGRIGRRVAELLSGFRVRILVYDPFLDEQAARERRVEAVTFEEVLRQADILSLHLPYTEHTHHLIDAQALEIMKDGAYLINTARGALVDEQALTRALQMGKLSGAGVDVYEKEPITKENPLMNVHNTVLSPHVSALTYETNYHGGLICAKSIIQVFEGGHPLYPLQ